MPTYQKALWTLPALPPLLLIIAVKILLVIFFFPLGVIAGLFLSALLYTGIYLYTNHSWFRWGILLAQAPFILIFYLIRIISIFL